ncbi:MAG TPA: hypothetical protein VFI02_18425, partial [Armatimonadota bacterium]|nr:hypothetical protein [Armatimonadota bacterium]
MLPGIPSFDEANLDRSLGWKDIGDAFQLFVHDTAKAGFPGLDRFTTGGKDGCIDLIHRTPEGNTAISCKYIGPRADPKDRWRADEKNLRNNITIPGNPPSSQLQYRPWYDRKRP